MWVLLDDRMGSVGQAKGVSLYLKNFFNIVEKQIVYTKWAKLPNVFKGASLFGINKQQSSCLSEKDLPDMVLSISRRTLPVARFIKKKSGKKTKIIQLMYPGDCGISDIDLIVVPQHDAAKCKKGNFFVVTGCAHRITKQKLDEAQEVWSPVFANLPRPWTAVIVGGSIKGRPFSDLNAKTLGEKIKEIISKTGGSILITTSRRTGIEAEKIIIEKIKNIPTHSFLWGDKSENPYMGYLACADRIIITGDSVSMCCEACATKKPVLVFEGENWLTPKHYSFVRSLYDGGYAISINSSELLNFQPLKYLDATAEIAQKILELR